MRQKSLSPDVECNGHMVAIHNPNPDEATVVKSRRQPRQQYSWRRNFHLFGQSLVFANTRNTHRTSHIARSWRVCSQNILQQSRRHQCIYASTEPRY
jgi:hypothetical protein